MWTTVVRGHSWRGRGGTCAGWWPDVEGQRMHLGLKGQSEGWHGGGQGDSKSRSKRGVSGAQGPGLESMSGESGPPLLARVEEA